MSNRYYEQYKNCLTESVNETEQFDSETEALLLQTAETVATLTKDFSEDDLRWFHSKLQHQETVLDHELQITESWQQILNTPNYILESNGESEIVEGYLIELTSRLLDTYTTEQLVELGEMGASLNESDWNCLLSGGWVLTEAEKKTEKSAKKLPTSTLEKIAKWGAVAGFAGAGAAGAVAAAGATPIGLAIGAGAVAGGLGTLVGDAIAKRNDLDVDVKDYQKARKAGNKEDMQHYSAQIMKKVKKYYPQKMESIKKKMMQDPPGKLKQIGKNILQIGGIALLGAGAIAAGTALGGPFGAAIGTAFTGAMVKSMIGSAVVRAAATELQRPDTSAEKKKEIAKKLVSKVKKENPKAMKKVSGLVKKAAKHAKKTGGDTKPAAADKPSDTSGSKRTAASKPARKGNPDNWGGKRPGAGRPEGS